MKEKVHQQLKEIKRSFHSVMNGPIAQSMRDKGTDYKINWGVPLITLQQMASTYEKDYELSMELWKEDIRECKVMATLLMPYNKMSEEIVDIWMEQISTQELAEVFTFNLVQHLSYAPQLAYKWIASQQYIRQIAGYTLVGRLFMRGIEPNARGLEEFLDQAVTALSCTNVGVRHAALNSIRQLANLGEVYSRKAKFACRDIISL